MQKVALITGSTKGIGLAIAQQLLAQKCRVILNYANDDHEAARVGELLASSFGQESFAILKADLSTYSGLCSFVDEVGVLTQSLDYLILNAAITDKTPFNKMEYGNWQKVMNTNLSIPFFLIQKMAPQIQKNGRIIFIGAILGKFPHATSISYGISKAAVHFMAQSLVKEFAFDNITVNVVAPGFVDTPWQKNKSMEHRQSIESKIALHRFATSEEVAQMVLSVIKNDYINGAVIPLDGGYCYQ